MAFDAGQHFWLVGYSFHFFVGVANIFWSWSFDCGWGTLSGLRSTLLAGLFGAGLVCWVWVVGELYSGCLHLYFCVILFCLSDFLTSDAFGLCWLVCLGLVHLCVCFCSFCGRSVDALVSRADERRGGLRYASGS